MQRILSMITSVLAVTQLLLLYMYFIIAGKHSCVAIYIPLHGQIKVPCCDIPWDITNHHSNHKILPRI